jgi:hypothetical protein
MVFGVTGKRGIEAAETRTGQATNVNTRVSADWWVIQLKRLEEEKGRSWGQDENIMEL